MVLEALGETRRARGAMLARVEAKLQGVEAEYNACQADVMAHFDALAAAVEDARAAALRRLLVLQKERTAVFEVDREALGASCAELDDTVRFIKERAAIDSRTRFIEDFRFLVGEAEKASESVVPMSDLGAGDHAEEDGGWFGGSLADFEFERFEVVPVRLSSGRSRLGSSGGGLGSHRDGDNDESSGDLLASRPTHDSAHAQSALSASALSAPPDPPVPRRNERRPAEAVAASGGPGFDERDLLIHDLLRSYRELETLYKLSQKTRAVSDGVATAAGGGGAVLPEPPIGPRVIRGQVLSPPKAGPIGGSRVLAGVAGVAGVVGGGGGGGGGGGCGGGGGGGGGGLGLGGGIRVSRAILPDPTW